MNSITQTSPRRVFFAAGMVWIAGSASVALLLDGCHRRPIVVQSAPATVIQNPAPAAPASPPIIIKEAPPPPRPEEPPPPPPSNEYKWIPGYWAVRDGQQEWVAGHWEMPPRGEATWVPPRWEQRDNGYVFVPGYWQ